jgi:alpha-methylacyl-CoA racemase
VRGLAESQGDPHLAARGVFVCRDGLVEAAPVPRFGCGTAVASAPSRATADEILARWAR